MTPLECNIYGAEINIERDDSNIIAVVCEECLNKDPESEV